MKEVLFEPYQMYARLGTSTNGLGHFDMADELPISEALPLDCGSNDVRSSRLGEQTSRKLHLHETRNVFAWAGTGEGPGGRRRNEPLY